MQFRTDLFPQPTKVFTVGELTRQIRGTLVICHSERGREWSGWEAATWTDRHDKLSSMEPRCRFTARSQFLKRADNTSSMSRFFSRAESVCFRRNSKRSSANSKPKDCLRRNANGPCRNFRGESES